MKNQDARQLPAEAQEDLRCRAVRAVLDLGLRPTEAARTFGVSRTSIYQWLNAYDARGERGLRSRPRGRPRGARLKGYQAATVVRLMARHCPSELGLPFALWTREAVRDLLAQRYRIRVSVWTAGRYLRHWGFTPQKPLRRAYEQDPRAVRRWLEEEYPAIRAQARQENAEIHWGDQMGLRSEHQAGRSYGRRGHTPVVPGTGQRFGCNVISTITNRGRLAFMVFRERFVAKVMIRFLRRLVRQARRRVFLIIDRHPVHLAAAVERWVQKHRAKIRIFHLPTYSPELNPDEYLNNDVKSNALGSRRPHGEEEMVQDVRSYLRSTQHRPDIVSSYFDHQSVAYAQD